jgi:Tic22-like family
LFRGALRLHREDTRFIPVLLSQEKNIMRSLIRWGLALSLLGGGMIAAPVLQPSAAIALTEAEALKRLERIPVFTVTDPKGNPILASAPNPKDKSKRIQFVNFFMNQQDALGIINTIKSQNPEVGKTATLKAIPLRQAYEFKNKNKDKAETLVFNFIPQKAQLDAAMDILKKDGKTVQQFNDIPMFFPADSSGKGLITFQIDKQTIIPFYFNKQDLQGDLEQIKKQNPKQGAKTVIKVTSLSLVLESLLKGKDQSTQQITLVPDRSALQYAVQQQGGQKPGAAPASNPTQSKPKAK